MQAVHRVARNTGILYAKMAITIFLSLYATRLVLLALGSKDFGLFSIVGGAIAMLGFLNASMAGATQRFMSFAQGAGDSHKMNKIFNMSVLLHLIIAIIIFIVLEVAGYFFFNGILNIDPAKVGTAKLIYQVMIVSTLFSVISVPYNALLNAHENMLFYAILGILESVLKLVIAFYITYAAGDKLLYYGILTACLSIVLLIINRIYCHSNYPESKIAIKAQYDKSVLKEMTGFAGWSLLGTSSSMTANYGSGIVLNMFFGTAINAAQGITNQLSGQLGAFASTMLRALNPIIDKSEGAGNRQAMLKATMFGSKVSFFLLLVFYVPIFIEMPFVLKLWLKEVPNYAIIFCRLFLIKNLIDQLFVTLVSAIAAVGTIKKYQIYSSLLTLFPLIISYFLFMNGFPPYSFYWVFIIYSIITSILILYSAQNNCNLSIKVFLNDVVIRSVITLLLVVSIASIPQLLLPEGIPRLVCTTVISVLLFLITVWKIGLIKEEQSEIIKVSNTVRIFLKNLKNKIII